MDGLRLPNPGLLSWKSFGSSESSESLGILDKRSPTVGPLAGLGLNPPNFGLDVVDSELNPPFPVLCSVLGLNRFENLLLLLFLRLRKVSMPLEGAWRLLGVNRGLLLVVLVSNCGDEIVGSVDSSSGLPILIPSRCLKRSAKDLGLNVVVFLVVIGAKVLILNKLIREVVGGS